MEEVGGGGSGQVHRAMCRTTFKECVVKCVHRQSAEGEARNFRLDLFIT